MHYFLVSYLPFAFLRGFLKNSVQLSSVFCTERKMYGILSSWAHAKQTAGQVILIIPKNDNILEKDEKFLFHPNSVAGYLLLEFTFRAFQNKSNKA